MELKRRDFLKITGLLGAGFFGKVNINEADPYNVWKPIIPDQLDKTETVCPLCESYCKLEVLKKRELIFGLYKKDETKGLCPKVIAYHNIIYGEGRIKTPLLRIKERGTFAFKPIDYDRAFKILKDKLGKAEFYADANATGEAERFFVSTVSSRVNFVPNNRLKAICGAEKIYFDLENAALVLNFGSDLLTDGNFIERANYLAANAKNVISLTPTITKGSALGEKWYPVKLSELATTVKKLREALLGKAEKDTLIDEIVNRVKKAKNVCVTFSPSILESEEGVAAVKEIVLLATHLKIINREGGIFFYNTPTSSKPFNFFAENIDSYLAYNIDPLLLYPMKDTVSRLKSLPFVVYMGHHHSDISLYADLIFPLPFFVEKKETYIKKTSKGYKFIKSDFAIDGGVESQELRKKENIEVIFQKMLNFKAPYGIKGIDEIAKELKPSLPTLQSYLISLEKKAGVNAVTPVISIKDEYNKKDRETDILLIQHNALDFNTQGSKWAEELDCRNLVLMNSNTAAKLKVKHRDFIKITGSAGSIQANVFVFDGIVDNAVSLNRFRKKTTLGTPYRTVSKTKDKETALIWWKPEQIEIENLFSYNHKYENLALIGSDKIVIEKV